MAEPQPEPELQVPREPTDAAANTQPDSELEPEFYSPKLYADLISTLPTRTGWAQPLALYENYWLTPSRLRHVIPVKQHYTPRRDDILLATFPKCGTTWLKALAVAITTRRIAAGGGSHHAHRHPQEAVPHLELPALAGDLAHIERMPSPRLLATHLPLSLLPPAVLGSGCRVVYLCRHSKDAFVSWWFFVNTMMTTTRNSNGQSSSSVKLEMDEAVRMFCEGFSPLGPFWEHYLEYWDESVARPPEEVLFLRYEEMVADPVGAVRRLADLFSVPFTDEEVRGGVPEEVVRQCSFETLSGREENRTDGGDNNVAFGDGLAIGRKAFFRKGQVGDWENHLTEEMGRVFDRVLQDRFKGSGLVF